MIVFLFVVFGISVNQLDDFIDKGRAIQFIFFILTYWLIVVQHLSNLTSRNGLLGAQ